MAKKRSFVFSYQVMLTTGSPVSRHYLLLRCLPAEVGFQRVRSLCLTHHGFDYLSLGSDSFGTRVLTGGAFAPHRTLMWQSSGVVEQTPYEILGNDGAESYVFALPTPHTLMDADMAAAVEELRGRKADLETALELNSQVHGMLQYESGSTTIATTAATAFHQGRGVCQDFAHLMLACARYLKFQARYAAGLIAGDGQTHAWVELLIDGRWLGFDPTHGLKIDFGYIKLCHGRDAMDCQVCRGVFTGNASQRSLVHVLVGEA